MSWKFIFRLLSRTVNGKNMDIHVANSLCLKAGYQFFLFNGIVYFALPTTPIQTEITVEDLF